jgi:hypothetical protein
MSRRGAAMALVVTTGSDRAIPRPQHIRGIITKEHVADSVARTVPIYPDYRLSRLGGAPPASSISPMSCAG